MMKSRSRKVSSQDPETFAPRPRPSLQNRDLETAEWGDLKISVSRPVSLPRSVLRPTTLMVLY